MSGFCGVVLHATVTDDDMSIPLWHIRIFPGLHTVTVKKNFAEGSHRTPLLGRHPSVKVSMPVSGANFKVSARNFSASIAIDLEFELTEVVVTILQSKGTYPMSLSRYFVFFPHSHAYWSTGSLSGENEDEASKMNIAGFPRLTKRSLPVNLATGNVAVVVTLTEAMVEDLPWIALKVTLYVLFTVKALGGITNIRLPEPHFSENPGTIGLMVHWKARPVGSEPSHFDGVAIPTKLISCETLKGGGNVSPAILARGTGITDLSNMIFSSATPPIQLVIWTEST